MKLFILTFALLLSSTVYAADILGQQDDMEECPVSNNSPYDGSGGHLVVGNPSTDVPSSAQPGA